MSGSPHLALLFRWEGFILLAPISIEETKGAVGRSGPQMRFIGMVGSRDRPQWICWSWRICWGLEICCLRRDLLYEKGSVVWEGICCVTRDLFCEKESVDWKGIRCVRRLRLGGVSAKQLNTTKPACFSPGGTALRSVWNIFSYVPRSFKQKYIGVSVAVCWYVQLKSRPVTEYYIIIILNVASSHVFWLKSSKVSKY